MESQDLTIRIMGCPVDFVNPGIAAEQLVNHMTTVVSGDSVPSVVCRVVVSANPELIVRCENDSDLRQTVEVADLRIPDGVGVVLAGWRKKHTGLVRVPGIEFAERIVGLSCRRGVKVFLLGGREGVAEAVVAAWGRDLPAIRVVGTCHGYFAPGGEAEAEVVGRIRDSRADLLLVALGSPKQELFVERNKASLGVRLAMGVGGSFDVWSGRQKRAPQSLRRLGLEWLYRLARDPRRLRRQARLAVFVWKALILGR